MTRGHRPSGISRGNLSSPTRMTKHAAFQPCLGLTEAAARLSALTIGVVILLQGPNSRHRASGVNAELSERLFDTAGSADAVEELRFMRVDSSES